MSARLSARGYKQRGEYPLWRYGAKGDGTADDTVAIQDAIDAAAAAGGGSVILPVGVFLVGGSMKTYNTNKKAQILVPTTARDMTSTLPWAGIRLVGEGAVPLSQWGYIATAGMTLPTATSTATIKSLDGTPGGSIFGVPTATVQTFFPVSAASALSIDLENIQFLTAVDPYINVIDAYEALNLKIDRCLFAAHDPFYATNQPIHGGAGVICPNIGNGAMITIGEMIAYGFTTGIIMSEHIVFSNISCFGCGTAATLRTIDHSVGGGRILIQDCLNGVNFDNQSSPKISVQFRLDFEALAGGWSSGGNDINDPSDIGTGIITYHMGGGGTRTTINVNGGTNLTITNLGR